MIKKHKISKFFPEFEKMPLPAPLPPPLWLVVFHRGKIPEKISTETWNIQEIYGVEKKVSDEMIDDEFDDTGNFFSSDIVLIWSVRWEIHNS